jgi:hypothetical protein
MHRRASDGTSDIYREVDRKNVHSEFCKVDISMEKLRKRWQRSALCMAAMSVDWM